MFRFSFPLLLLKVFYLIAYFYILDLVVLYEIHCAEDGTLFSDSNGMYIFLIYFTEYQAAILHLKREHKEEIETLKVYICSIFFFFPWL